MYKCYSCGSTAQLKVEPIQRVTGGLMETFRCGCGCVTKIFYEKKIVDTRAHGTLIYREGAFK
jgi:hypothetical protein